MYNTQTLDMKAFAPSGLCLGATLRGNPDAKVKEGLAHDQRRGLNSHLEAIST
jgi:hypothetical protein